VAVVGGGQTGAEVTSYLVSSEANLPREIHWISRRSNFTPRDDSPFANELFTPGYSDYFFGLLPQEKARLLAENKLASEGISSDLLDSIYRRLYMLEFAQERGPLCKLHPGCELEDLDRCDGEWLLTLRDAVRNRCQVAAADIVILCTGFEYRVPDFLEPLKDRIHWASGGYCLNEDYSIAWDGPPDQKIYLQNGARSQRGLADPNLSLLAWRSAVIINSLTKAQVYKVEQARPMFELHAEQAAPQAVGAAG
jgi:lysine N6-hydroxylase